MNPKEFQVHIQERIAHHQMVCELAGHEVKDSDQVMTLIGTSMKGLPVRPIVLGSQFGKDGQPEKFYSFTLKQCKKLLRMLEDDQS